MHINRFGHLKDNQVTSLMLNIDLSDLSEVILSIRVMSQ